MRFGFHLKIFALVATAALSVRPALAAGGAGADEPAAPASQLQMAMTIYAGGVTLGTVDMDATIRDGTYHVVSNLQTSGIVNAFWKSQIQATSSGKVDSKTLQPSLYDSFDTNHASKKQEVSLNYESGGAPHLYADPPYSTTGYDVPPEMQKATFDPLSAVMFLTSGVAVSADNPCGVTAPVFDGRRRYNIELSKLKDTNITMDNGLYKGHAVLCAIKYRQIAGFRPNLIKQNEKFPPIQAWVATFPSAIAGRSYVIPLRVWAQTPFGLVAVVATSVKIDGTTPKATAS
jgi:hypothetical protein